MLWMYGSITVANYRRPRKKNCIERNWFYEPVLTRQILRVDDAWHTKWMYAIWFVVELLMYAIRFFVTTYT